MISQGTTIVFLGRTLSPIEAAGVLDAVYLPPVRQGDLYRAVRRYRPSCIGVVDGVFLDVPAVWHREILWALSQGIHVFGAASMGAMRAAELAPFGMRAIGRIATAFRDGHWPGCAEPFEDDDEVAVIHAPVEAGGAALSDAMVDLRDTLLAAEVTGVVDRTQREALIAAMKRLHFSERSFARLAALAGSHGAPALPGWLPANRIYRKRLDALELLRTIGEFLATDPEPFQPGFRFEHALVWQQFVADCDTLDAAERMVLDEARLDHVAWREAARIAMGPLEGGGNVTPAALHVQLDRLRQRHALWQRAELDAWLVESGLDVAGLERLLRQEAVLEGLIARPGAALGAAVLDHMRITGRFTAVLQRARTKAAATTAAQPPPTGPHLQAVLEWFFEQRLGCAVPNSIATHASDTGWAGEDEFVLAVWREYLFNKNLQ